MIKLSKESKWVFFSLLLVPIIWIGLNYAGVVDYLENKSIDLRFKVRGNLDHRSASNESVLVDKESNQTVPKIPKVIYVNFDAKTLSLDEVGKALGIIIFQRCSFHFIKRKARWLVSILFFLKKLIKYGSGRECLHERFCDC